MAQVARAEIAKIERKVPRHVQEVNLEIDIIRTRCIRYHLYAMELANCIGSSQQAKDDRQKIRELMKGLLIVMEDSAKKIRKYAGEE